MSYNEHTSPEIRKAIAKATNKKPNALSKALNAKKEKVYKVPVGGYIKEGKVIDPYKKGSKILSKIH